MCILVYSLPEIVYNVKLKNKLCSANGATLHGCVLANGLSMLLISVIACSL